MLLSSQLCTPETKPESSANFWDNWLEEQTKYYLKASKREIARSKKGITTFNLAFTLVALIGLGVSIRGFFDPAAFGSDGFCALMPIASLIGSCGLAYVNFVKDRKAFDQSTDYDHLHKVLSANIKPRVNAREGELFQSLVFTETLNEHLRWALRMAGHFKTVPT